MARPTRKGAVPSGGTHRPDSIPGNGNSVMVAEDQSRPTTWHRGKNTRNDEVRDYLSAVLGVSRNSIQVHLSEDPSPTLTEDRREDVHRRPVRATERWTRVSRKQRCKKSKRKAKLRPPSVKGTSGYKKFHPCTTIHPGLYMEQLV